MQNKLFDTDLKNSFKFSKQESPDKMEFAPKNENDFVDNMTSKFKNMFASKDQSEDKDKNAPNE